MQVYRLEVDGHSQFANTIGNFAGSQVVADALTRRLHRDRFLAKAQRDARRGIGQAAAATAKTSELAAECQP